MRYECTRRASNATRLLLAAGLLALPAPLWAAAAPAHPSGDAVSLAQAHLDPYEDLLQFLRNLYVLLGGNPADLESRDSAESMMSLVGDYYWTHGLPPLNPVARESLIQTIHDLYSLLGNPPSSVNPQAASSFRKTLLAMWVALGLDPLVLERLGVPVAFAE